MGTRPASAAFVLVAVASFASSAAAQVNVEAIRKKIRDEGFSGGVEASVTGRAGNMEGLLASGVGQIGWGSSRHLAFLHARGDYSRMNDRLQVARSFVHARYNLTIVEDRLFGEVFAQTQSDAFLLLRHRDIVGAGPRFEVVARDDLQLYVGLAWMLEYERVEVPAGASDPPRTLLHRGSSYVALSITSDDRVSFTLTTYFQPRIDRPRDHRFVAEPIFQVSIGKGFGVRITGTLRYDSEPVTTVKTTDVEVRNAVTWTF